MLIRPRRDADIGSCVRLAEAVQDADGYPIHVTGSLRDFLVSRDGLAAWVAERDDTIVGHVALHGRGADAVVSLAAARLEQATDRLGVVARLFVAPDARRQGIGRALLETAAGEAIARGLWPVLDVPPVHDAAVRLYEACGWVRAGLVTSRLGDGFATEEIVFFDPRSRPA
ncbi:MAG: GNAT family N-acetyltransferase [Acidimicrobiales bacterium]